jgi:hypothetical protein
MRVLCSTRTRPMDGGFGPFTPLGRALVEGEHEVIVASGSEPAGACRRERPGVRGGGSAGHGRAMAAMADTEVKEAPPGDRIAFPAAMFGSVHPSAKLPALRELEASRPVDLILHPPVDLSGPLLAAELGVPSVCYGFGQPFDPDVVAAMGLERGRCGRGLASSPTRTATSIAGATWTRARLAYASERLCPQRQAPTRSAPRSHGTRARRFRCGRNSSGPPGRVRLAWHRAAVQPAAEVRSATGGAGGRRGGGRRHRQLS